MHLCPECEADCDCDGEDLFYDTAPDDCEHECDDDDSVFFDEDDEDDDDGFYDD